MRERVVYLDAAKGLAMVTIVMLHLSSFNLQGNSATTINSFNHSFNTRLFFVLSGMVAVIAGGVNVECGLKSAFLFVKKKTRTLFIPFLIWGAGILPFLYGDNVITTFPTVLREMFLPPFNGYWFLLYLYIIQLMFLAACFLSYWLSFLVSDKFKRDVCAYVIISVLMFPIYEYALFFIIGYFLQKYGEKLLEDRIFCSISFVLFLVLFCFVGEKEESSDTIIHFSTALTASLFLITILWNLQRKGMLHGSFAQLLSYLGKNSLEIYLVHYYLIWICKDCLLPVSDIHAIPLYVIVFVVSIAVCWLCCKIADILKQVPYMSMLLFGNH